MIHIVTILGSARSGNYTGKALALVHDELRGNDRVDWSTIDPANLDLAVPGKQTDTSDGDQLMETVSLASGVIIATPEYHGSYSSVTKLIIDNLGFPSVLAGKPIALLGVAAGQIGAIKALEHLRSVCSHVGAIVLPGAVSVAGVRSVFDEQSECNDERLEKRIRSVATNLIDYVSAHTCPRAAQEQMARD